MFPHPKHGFTFQVLVKTEGKALRECIDLRVSREESVLMGTAQEAHARRGAKRLRYRRMSGWAAARA